MIFVHDLALRLAPDCIPLMIADGLRQYFWALTAHFGHWVKRHPWRKHRWLVDPRLLYAQLVKVCRGRKLKKTITRVLCGDCSSIRQKLISLGFTGTVGTSFMERFKSYPSHGCWLNRSSLVYLGGFTFASAPCLSGLNLTSQLETGLTSG